MKTFLVFLLLFNFCFASECEKAKEFSLRNSEADLVTLDLIRQENSDSFIFISFFQTTCVPCISEIKHLMEFIQSHKRFKLVLVNFKEDKSLVPKFILNHDFKYDYLLFDPYGQLDVSYNVKNIPRLIVIDKSNIIRASFFGKEIKELIDQGRLGEKFLKLANINNCKK